MIFAPYSIWTCWLLRDCSCSTKVSSNDIIIIIGTDIEYVRCDVPEGALPYSIFDYRVKGGTLYFTFNEDCYYTQGQLNVDVGLVGALDQYPNTVYLSVNLPLGEDGRLDIYNPSTSYSILENDGWYYRGFDPVRYSTKSSEPYLIDIDIKAQNLIAKLKN